MARRPAVSTPLTATALLASGLLVAGLAAPAALAADTAAAPATPSAGTRITDTGPEVLSQQATGLPDLDVRGSISPTSAQRSAVPSGATVRWNRFGTPSSLLNRSGYLSGARTGSATSIARSWLSSHHAVLGLSSSAVSGLELLSDSRLMQSTAHAVRFRQSFGGVAPATGGMVTLAVDPQGRVSYVSSSLSRATSAAPAATLSPLTAWAKAVTELRAKDAPAIATPAISGLTTRTVDGWTTFKVPGFAQTQQVRLRTLPVPGAASRPVFEANVVNSAGGAAAAYTSYVDARTGQVLVRHNQVDNLSDAPVPATTTSEPFQGSYTASSCGPDHDYTVDAATKSIVVAASADLPAEDIVLKLLHNGAQVASSDTATSPEGITYSPAGGVPAGTYTVRVCPFQPDPTVPVVAGQYSGFFLASEQGTPTDTAPYPPKWKYFVANPALSYSPTSTTDNRKVGCWVKQGTDCSVPPTPLQNSAARGPWDYDFKTNLPTNTTRGNAAFTGEAWASPLTPGGGHQMPVSVNRHYGYDNPGQDFTDAWNNSKCSPTNLTPGGNDVSPRSRTCSPATTGSTTTRTTSASPRTTTTCRSRTSATAHRRHRPDRRRDDPEVGNVQAGALTRRRPTTSRAATTPTRSRCRTASPASPTSTCSSRSPVRSTRPAWTATSTPPSSATSTRTRSPTAWSAAPTTG